MAHLSVSGLPGLDHSSELPASAGGQWAGGRPRQLGDDDEDFVIQTATTRPVELGQPFTRWSLRRLVAYLHKVHARVISLGREALRCLLARRGVPFQRTKTWKEPPDREREMELDRSGHILDRFPDRVFAFDEFGPLGIRPTAGSGWAEQRRPDRVPATYHRTHEVRYFHGCYSVGDDRLWGVNRRKKGAVNTLAALKSIRASPRPTPRGRTRSRRTSGRCGSSPSPTPSTPTTPCRPRPWPPSATNAPASEARRASAGAAALSKPQPDRNPANLRGHSTGPGWSCLRWRRDVGVGYGQFRDW